MTEELLVRNTNTDVSADVYEMIRSNMCGPRSRRMSKDDINRLAIAVKEDNDFALELLIEQVSRLIWSEAVKNSRSRDDTLDILQDLIGSLKDLCKSFDADKGTKFTSYLVSCLRNLKQRALNKVASGVINLPIELVIQRSKMQRTRDRLENKLFRTPTNQEIADAMSISLHKLQSIQATDFEYVPVYKAYDQVVEDVLESDDATLETSYLTKEMKQHLFLAIQELPENQASVIKARYLEGLPRNQAVEKLGIPFSTMRVIEAKALETLKHKLQELTQ